MKKVFFLFITICAFISFTKAQSVPREMVAVEDATGTWCTYCPGAQLGTDELLGNGKFVAVIGNHTGDSYTNTYSSSRLTLYNINYLPGITFDGNLGYEGGNHTSSMYSKYLPKYNTCIAVESPVSLSMEISNSGLSYTATITITKIGDLPSTNTVLFFFVTQSNIQQNWQGQTHLEHVNRLMAPDANGTPVDFTSGDVQTVILNFDMDSAWPLEDCEFIALFQNTAAGQGNISGMTGAHKHGIYQCIKRGTIDLAPEFSASSTVVTTQDPVTFTNMTTGGYIGTPETYEWIFPGANPSTSIEKDPTIVYTEAGNFDVTLIVNRGGQIDTLTKTAYITSSFPSGVQEKSNFVNAQIYPNPNNGEFTLELNPVKSVIADLTVTNTSGTVIYKENGLNINGKTIKHLKLGTLSAGIYYLSIQNADSKTIQKLLVK